jgi:subtilisin family serine protease
VLFGAAPESRAAIEQARFSVIADGPLATVPGRILRVRAPAGMGERTALRRLATAAPGATLARNDRYRSFLRPASRSTAAPGRAILLNAAVGCAVGVTIAMVDTDVDAAHPALAGASISRMTLRAPDRAPSSARHGTAVASMLVGRESGPAPGLAPAARLVAVDAFHRDGAGQDATDAFDLARALDLLATQEAAVINLSLTGPDNAVLERLVARLVADGRRLVAAAGNDGPRARPSYPAAYPGVLAVTAVDAEGAPWRRAARGAHVAFAALGVDLGLAGRNGAAEPYTGTSFAAPAVSAMIAAESLSQRPSGPSVAEWLARLAEDRGEPGRDAVYGFGLLKPADACNAVAKAAQD